MAESPVARSAAEFPDLAPSTAATVWLADRSAWSKVLIHHHGTERTVFGSVVSAEAGALIVGWAPGQTLIIGDGDTTALLSGIPDADQQVDVSHGFTLLSITGSGSEATLAKLCGIDLSTRTPAGTITRTSVAKVATGVIKLETEEPSFLLMCDRSYGQYLCEEILVAAAEFGVGMAGPEA